MKPLPPLRGAPPLGVLRSVLLHLCHGLAERGRGMQGVHENDCSPRVPGKP